MGKKGAQVSYPWMNPSHWRQESGGSHSAVAVHEDKFVDQIHQRRGCVPKGPSVRELEVAVIQKGTRLGCGSHPARADVQLEAGEDDEERGFESAGGDESAGFQCCVDCLSVERVSRGEGQRYHWCWEQVGCSYGGGS